jgi:hypothetical protein
VLFAGFAVVHRYEHGHERVADVRQPFVLAKELAERSASGRRPLDVE